METTRMRDGDRRILLRNPSHKLMSFRGYGGVKVEVDSDELYCWTPSSISFWRVLKFWWHKKL